MYIHAAPHAAYVELRWYCRCRLVGAYPLTKARTARVAGGVFEDQRRHVYKKVSTYYDKDGWTANSTRVLVSREIQTARRYADQTGEVYPLRRRCRGVGWGSASLSLIATRKLQITYLELPDLGVLLGRPGNRKRDFTPTLSCVVFEHTMVACPHSPNASRLCNHDKTSPQLRRRILTLTKKKKQGDGICIDRVSTAHRRRDV